MDDELDRNLDRIADEVRYQREVQGRKSASIQARATVLIGAAGLFGGLSLPTVTNVPDLVPALLLLVALGCGLMALRPASGEGVNAKLVADVGVTMAEVPLRATMIEANVIEYTHTKRALQNRVKWIEGGIVAFALAWVISFGLAVFLPMEAEQPVQVVILESK
jgi:hypothetical protein